MHTQLPQFGRLEIRKGDWKLIANANKKKREFYDLKTDNSEKDNFYGQENSIEKQEALMKDLTKIILSRRTTKGETLRNDGFRFNHDLFENTKIFNQQNGTKVNYIFGEH